VKPLHYLIAFGFAVALAAAGACSGADSGGHGEEPDAMLNPEDVSAAQDATDAPESLSTWLRFGHMVPGLGPITVCVLSPASDTWTPLLAPLVGVDAGPPDAGPADGSYDAPLEGGGDGAVHDAHPEASSQEGGLSDARTDARPEAGKGSPPEGGAMDAGAQPDLFPLTMSRYVELKGAGTFKLAVLPAGVGSCAGPYLTQTVTLDSAKHTTVVLVRTQPGPLASPRSYLSGNADAAVPFGILHFTDESSTTSPLALTRFISAVIPAGSDAGGGALSVAVLDTTANLVPLASVVPPDQAATPSQVSPTVDALGYHAGVATNKPLAIRLTPAGARTDAAGLSWTSAAELLSVGSGSIHTGFILSDPAEQFQVLWCNDLSDDPVLTECGLIRE
jgi:hypothetical protein